MLLACMPKGAVELTFLCRMQSVCVVGPCAGIARRHAVIRAPEENAEDSQKKPVSTTSVVGTLVWSGDHPRHFERGPIRRQVSRSVRRSGAGRAAA